MIKLFEEFILPKNNVSDQELVDMLSTIALLWNHSNTKSDKFDEFTKLADVFHDEPYNFITPDDGLFDWNDDYDFGRLTSENRTQIVNTYRTIFNRMQLIDFPDMDDIDDILSPIKDLTEVQLTIYLDEKKFSFDINTIPFVRLFPDINNIKIDFQPGNQIETWNSITSEIYPAYQRILDIGYDCELYLKKMGHYELKVSV